MDRVQEILEDTKERLRKEMPWQQFFFLLMPVYPGQIELLSTEALDQVQKRVVRHLQVEISQAIIDQRREK